jgi:DNA-binding MurR/RpiR family transcriptional regulator
MEVKKIDFRDLVEIKFNELSKSHKKVAKYILDKFTEVIFLTAKEISKKVSVSEVTVIRFAYALGYNGFSDMRKSMEESINGNIKNIKNDFDNNLYFNKLTSTQIEEFIHKKSYQYTVAYQNIDYNEFKKICDVLMTKKRILIIGFLGSFGTASELLHILASIRSRVYFSKLIYENAYSFDDMDEDSATIVVSYSPHYKYSISQAETVKNNGSTIVSVTDSTMSPLKDLSDYSLNFNLEKKEKYGVTDISPVLMFFNYMLDYICKNYSEKVDEYRNINKEKFEEDCIDLN